MLRGRGNGKSRIHGPLLEPTPASRKEKKASRSDARCDAREALQPAHRAIILRLGRAFHSLPPHNGTRAIWAKRRLAPLTRSSPTRSASRPVPSMSQLPSLLHSHRSGTAPERGSLDSEPGAERPRLCSSLYKEVLERKRSAGWREWSGRQNPKRLPVVLPRDEVHKIFTHLHGMPRLWPASSTAAACASWHVKASLTCRGVTRNARHVLCLCAEIRVPIPAYISVGYLLIWSAAG